MASVKETIGNDQWVVENFNKLRELFPAQSTQVTQRWLLQMRFAFRCMGVEFSSEAEFSQVLVVCNAVGVYTQQRENGCLWVKRSEYEVPGATFFRMTQAQVSVNRILRAEPSAEVVALAHEAIERIRCRTS